MAPKARIPQLDSRFLDHHAELAAKSGEDLCDCWVTRGIAGKWYPSVTKKWCRTVENTNPGLVGTVFPVGSAKKFPREPDQG